jgi:hypothetical protein
VELNIKTQIRAHMKPQHKGPCERWS